MAQTDCDWNRDLDKFPNCCIWTRPWIECSHTDKAPCNSYQPRNPERIVTIPLTRCLECE